MVGLLNGIKEKKVMEVKKWRKALAIFLSMLFVMEVMPLSAMAQEVTDANSVKIETRETVVADIFICKH